MDSTDHNSANRFKCSVYIFGIEVNMCKSLAFYEIPLLEVIYYHGYPLYCFIYGELKNKFDIITNEQILL